MQYGEEQRAAIVHATTLSNRVTAITGPAGTGKTVLMQEINKTFTEKGHAVVLCAPTGKAARRIKEATGIQAVTIHKLLEYGRPGDRDEKTGKAVDPTYPKRNSRNRLEQTIVLCDEYAMVNQELHTNLFAALPSGGKVCVFGDQYQLPPIEPYVALDRNNKRMVSPFKRLLERDQYVCYLTQIYRQAEDSNILNNANRICFGRTPDLNKDLGDWMCKITDQPVKSLIAYIEWAKENKDIDFKLLGSQIITPGKKSWVGTHKLNQMLRSLLNPHPSQTIKLARHKWDEHTPAIVGIGDKVMCHENKYDLRDYFERFARFQDDGVTPVMQTYIPVPDTKMMLNGEIGIVVAINVEDQSIEIDFGDRIVELPHEINEYWMKKNTIIKINNQKDLSLGYALTTHKTQGSEYDNVCYMLNKSTKYIQSREGFYTSVTRAKKTCVVITDQMSLRYSLNTKKG